MEDMLAGEGDGRRRKREREDGELSRFGDWAAKPPRGGERPVCNVKRPVTLDNTRRRLSRSLRESLGSAVCVGEDGHGISVVVVVAQTATSPTPLAPRLPRVRDV